MNKDAVLVPEMYREQMPENKAKTQGSVSTFFCGTRYEQRAGSYRKDPLLSFWAMKDKMTLYWFPAAIRPHV